MTGKKAGHDDPQGRTARSALRHFFVTELFRRGGSAPAVQLLAGHLHLATTQRYAHLVRSDLRATISLLDGRGNSGATASLPLPSRAPLGRRNPQGFQVVGRQGLEPWTYGLKAPGDPEQFPVVTAEMGHLLGHLVGRLAARAKVVLAAIAAGDPIAYDLMVGLAVELAALGQGAEQVESRDASMPAGERGRGGE